MNKKCSELKRLSRAGLLGNFPIVICAYVLVSAIVNIVTRVFTLPVSNLYEEYYMDFIMGERVTMPEITELPISCYVGFAAVIVVSIISTVLYAGIARIQLNLMRGEKFSIGYVFGEFRHRPDRYIVAALLKIVISLFCYLPGLVFYILAVLNIEESIFLVYMMVSIVAMIVGMILDIFFRIKLMLSTYLLVDNENLSAVNSFKDSFDFMNGHVLRAVYIYLSFIPMTILTILTFGLGGLWVQPYMEGTFVNFYLDVIGEFKRIQEEERRLDEEMGPSFETYV